MAHTLTVKGQVTIPKPIRDALGLRPGSAVDFTVNEAGQVVLQRAAPAALVDRFERVRGRAEVKWRTEELMELLRGEP